MSVNIDAFTWWSSLRHSGLLLDRKRLENLFSENSKSIDSSELENLREVLELGVSRSKGETKVIDYVLTEVCGLKDGWLRGANVSAKWSRRDRDGSSVRPDRLWQSDIGGILPVFTDRDSKTLGVGKSRRTVSRVLQWLRAGQEKLALVTNGRQWRLIFAGLDFDAWCEWDTSLWFEEGLQSPQLHALTRLLSPRAWTPVKSGEHSPLLAAIEESRKGQADLSAALGERVRLAVEKLIDAHQAALDEHAGDLESADVYRAAVRIVMRLVVVLFAEARGLLPVDNTVYHNSYGLRGLHDDLRRKAKSRGHCLSSSAWPRLLALFKLVHSGSFHPDLAVRPYGGELFAPGDQSSTDGISRAVWIFENSSFTNIEHEVRDDVVFFLLNHLSQTRERIRQGTATKIVPVPVDFSDLSSEYIGILYEGLLDYELKTVPEGDAVIIMPLGNRPALPLSRLEQMSEQSLTQLFAKLAKDSSTKSDSKDSEDEDDDSGDTDDSDSGGDENSTDNEVEPEDTDVQEESDAPLELDERLLKFLRQIVVTGKMVPSPRGRLTPEKQLEYEAAITKKAMTLAQDVHKPGKRYLIRWGGTRKGSGTFYTRPTLSGPTTHRTLLPLAYKPPQNADGSENLEASFIDWTPNKPEETLSLKVCDISCGSGAFPVASLRFLTQAVWDGIHHYERIKATTDNRTAVSLFGRVSDGESLADEYLPCLPDDDSYEPRLRALIKRHVAERCIYAVDLDPLAVELCRLSIWIETLDPTLPFTFIDHKIKCGNSLVGTWYDRYRHYPPMAFAREAGDKSNNASVNYEKGAQTKVLKEYFSDSVKPCLLESLKSQQNIFVSLQRLNPTNHHKAIIEKLINLHSIPVFDSENRAATYNDLINDSDFIEMKNYFDMWCSLWFWPVNNLDIAPLPTEWGSPSSRALILAKQIAHKNKFFHWEIEFPDVFTSTSSGFDAILGNPPWDIAMPNSKEFFSNIDPLYRSYSKQQGLVVQKNIFMKDAESENNWRSYCDQFMCMSNWIQRAAFPFGERIKTNGGRELSFGKAYDYVHSKWHDDRNSDPSYAFKNHPFVVQGGGHVSLYKCFIEMGIHLLKKNGRLGYIVPGGIYSDNGTIDLRSMIINENTWEWLFNFENRKKVFKIDSRFKFNPIIIQKSSKTNRIKAAFMRQDLLDWDINSAEEIVGNVDISSIAKLSPSMLAIPEIRDNKELKLLMACHKHPPLSKNNWVLKYTIEFNATTHSAYFPDRKKWIDEGYRQDIFGRWLKGNWKDGISGIASAIGYDCIEPSEIEDVAFPVYEGKSIWQHDCAYSAPSSNGRGKWQQLNWDEKILYSRVISGQSFHKPKCVAKLAMRDVSSPTNQRTFIASIIPDYPCIHKVPVISYGYDDPRLILALSTALNSLVFDAVVRVRFAPSGGGGSLIRVFVEELPVWDPKTISEQALDAISSLGAALTGGLPMLAPTYSSLPTESQYFVSKCVYYKSEVERLRLRCISDAVNGILFGISRDDFIHIIQDCWYGPDKLSSKIFTRSLFPKLFWRVDKHLNPQVRHPILSLKAFCDLIELANDVGNIDDSICMFIGYGEHKGWQLPTELNLGSLGINSNHETLPVKSLLNSNIEPTTNQIKDLVTKWQEYSNILGFKV